MMHFFQVYKCTFFKYISALFSKKIKAFINKFLYELILYKKRFEQQCSDIVKVDSQKELTQSTFLFFIL